MRELEELKRQKREINNKIKALENDRITFGNVFFEKYEQGITVGNGYRVCIFADIHEKIPKYHQIVRNKDKEYVIKYIANIIKDLQMLLDKLKGENVVTQD